MELQEANDSLHPEFETEKNNNLAKIRYFQDQKQKSKEDYNDMMQKFESTIKALGKERDKAKEKNSKEYKTWM